MRLIIVVLILLFFVGALPTWPHSHDWGYYPSGGVGTLLIVVILLMLLGVI